MLGDREAEGRWLHKTVIKTKKKKNNKVIVGSCARSIVLVETIHSVLLQATR
jgi:hypothetical protein